MVFMYVGFRNLLEPIRTDNQHIAVLAPTSWIFHSFILLKFCDSSDVWAVGTVERQRIVFPWPSHRSLVIRPSHRRTVIDHVPTACTLRFEKRDGREPSPSNLSVRSDWHLPHLIITKLNPSQVQIVTYRLPHVGTAEAEQLVLEHLLEGARLGLALEICRPSMKHG